MIEMLRRSGIRVRLTLWYVLLLALILALFSTLLYLILDRALYGQVDEGLRLSAEQVRGAVRRENGRLQVVSSEGESEVTPLGERGLLVRVIDMEGRVAASAGPFRALTIPPEALDAARQGLSLSSTTAALGNNAPVRIYTVPYIEDGTVYGSIHVGQSLEEVQETLQRLVLILAVMTPLTLLLASAGGLFLANRALSPIDRVTRATQRISAEHLDQRLNLALPDDEVGRLARTLDGMLERLDEAFRRQRQFTADASHELRTPLAIMKGNIGVALHRPRQPAEYRAVLTDVEEEVDRLTRLVEDLLLLARTDTGQPLLHREPLDLVGLLQVVAEQVQPMAEAKGIALDVDLPPSLQIEGDPDKLVRLFLNLLDNAVKYTPEGGHVALRAAEAGKRGELGGGGEPGERGVMVQIVDDGPGVPPDQLPLIFERFYRADTSRSRTGGGAGLGLALARSIAEAHGGRIEVQSAREKGSTFTVWLPAPDDQPSP